MFIAPVLTLLIDAKAFPIVRLHYDREDPSEQSNNLTLFETLLDREQPFVLIGHGNHSHQHSHEERRGIALWMKRNRNRLQSRVKAMVYVEPDTVKRMATPPAAFVFEKFWGFPLLVSGSDLEASAVAESLLATAQR